ncbi:hypothetical protein H4Q26_008955 [Puccinia striiformis f. sp. tritici PST-130]|nr:hypothetical protein H4Q26_008955 [Puccinia striiformis f. sp. tritici PST-130]
MFGSLINQGLINHASTTSISQEPAADEQEGFILTLTPLPTKVKFRTRLGLIKGELQFKLLQITRYSFQKLELELTGMRRHTKQNQLIHSNIILWSNETDDNSAVPPSLSLSALESAQLT